MNLPHLAPRDVTETVSETPAGSVRTHAGETASAPRPSPARVVLASLGASAALAAVLVFAVLFTARESIIVGATLIMFAVGWGMLAWFTTSRTGSPQRWAFVPATLLAGAGVAMVGAGPGEPVMTQLAWAWAPGLIALGGYVAWRARSSGAALLISPVAFAMVLAGLGGLYQAGTPVPQAAAGAMPGRLIDVGGYRLHLDCRGSGTPTVVLLNGLGETSPQWVRVGPEIARTARVCAYDRAGQGWSEDSPNPADATNAAMDLHRLLHAAGEAGPVVLAGHSSGGVHALAYTSIYPEDVAGMVLLDSASPYQVELVKPFSGEYELMRRLLAVVPTLFRFGLGHVVGAISATPGAGTAGAQAAVFANSPRGMRGMRAEQAALPDSFRQAQALTTLGSLPLVVLTAKENVDQRPGWDTAQDRLARLSTNARHVVADLSHMAFLEEPAGAELSIDAITDVVVSVRSHAALPTR